MSKQPEDIERWRDNRRADGLSVVEGIEGWIVMNDEGGAALSECPCCNKPFLTAKAAKLVADLAYPMKHG